MIISGIGIFCSLATIVACLTYEWKNQSPFVMLWLLLIAFAFMPLMGIYFEGNGQNYSIAVASVFISVYNIIYLCVCLVIDFSYQSYNKKHTYALDLEISNKKSTLLALTAISIPLVLVLNGLDVNALLDSTLADKRSLTTWYLIIIILSCSLFPGLIYSTHNKKNILTIVISFVFIIIALYFRSRSMLVMLLLPIGYYFLFSARHGLIKLTILGIIAFIASQILKIIRYQGSLRDGLNIFNWGDTSEYVMSNSLESGDLSIVRVFLQITEDCGTKLICGEWSLIIKYLSKINLVDPIKSTFEYYLYDTYIESGVNGSLHPTAYGFAYGDGGQYFGVIYFFMLPFLRLFILKILIETNRNLFYIGFVMYFILYFSRGSVYNALTLLLIPMIIELCIRIFLFIFSRKMTQSI